MELERANQHGRKRSPFEHRADQRRSRNICGELDDHVPMYKRLSVNVRLGQCYSSFLIFEYICMIDDDQLG